MIFTWVLVALSVVGFVLGFLGIIHVKMRFSAVERQKDLANYGQYGDAIGGVFGTYLTFSTVCLLLANFLVERRKLEELKAEQKRDQFEKTFFQMLTLHHEIVKDQRLLRIPLRREQDDDSRTDENLDQYELEDIRMLEIRGDIEGRRCFRSIYTDLKEFYASTFPAQGAERLRISRAYDKLYGKHQAALGHYFRHLFRIVRFIDKSDRENKVYYIKLVRAQMSDFELLLLFYNCLTSTGRRHFKGLVEKFGFFGEFPEDQLILPEQHKAEYLSSAFADQEAD